MNPLAGLLLVALISTGCATYYLPATRLESPEAVGKEGLLRVSPIRIQSGANLSDAGNPESQDSEGNTISASTQSAFLKYALDALFSVSDQFDAGMRFQIGAPLLLRAAYQVAGEPESRAKKGNLALSINGGVGILIGSESGTGTTYLGFDLGLTGGWRMGDQHVLLLSPLFSFASLSGTNEREGSATQFGASLGYKLIMESVFAQLEIALTSGSIGEETLPGVSIGLGLGFQI